MPRVEQAEIDVYLDTLIDAYILSLYKASAEVVVSETITALKALNSAREKAGLRAITDNSEEYVIEALDRAKKYRKMLEDKQGSYVVKEIEGKEKLVFEPWIKNLREDIKKQLLAAFSQAKKEGWKNTKLNQELDKIQETMIKKRVEVTAFCETRVLQYQTQMSVWDRGAEYVKRFCYQDARTCGICWDLDGQIFKIGEEPPLSHPFCRCGYNLYFPEEK